MICAAYSEQCTNGLHINQDHLGYVRVSGTDGREITMALVADGVSMGFEGKYASYNTAVTLLEWARDYFRQEPFDMSEAAAEIQEILQELNDRLNAFSEQHSDQDTCTTVCGCVTDGEDVLIFNAGDSRAYLLTADSAGSLTTDDKADDHESIAMHVGGMESGMLKVTFLSAQMTPGSRFLFCTDGLYRQLRMEEWCEAAVSLHTQEALKALLQKMADTVREAGETDDISGVLVAGE